MAQLNDQLGKFALDNDDTELVVIPAKQWRKAVELIMEIPGLSEKLLASNIQMVQVEVIQEGVDEQNEG